MKNLTNVPVQTTKSVRKSSKVTPEVVPTEIVPEIVTPEVVPTEIVPEIVTPEIVTPEIVTPEIVPTEVQNVLTVEQMRSGTVIQSTVNKSVWTLDTNPVLGFIRYNAEEACSMALSEVSDWTVLSVGPDVKPEPVKAEKASQTIQARSEQLLLQSTGVDSDNRPVGLSYAEILETVLSEFPNAKTTVKCLCWYANNMKVKQGKILPNRPRGKVVVAQPKELTLEDITTLALSFGYKLTKIETE